MKQFNTNEQDKLYREIVGRLRIDKHLLDDELEEQAELYHRILDMVRYLHDVAEAAKGELEGQEALLFLKLRGNGEFKKTVEEVRSEIKADKYRIEAWLSFRAATANLEMWDGLRESWKARGFALTTLADLAQAGYYATDSMKERVPVRSVSRGSESGERQRPAIRRR